MWLLPRRAFLRNAPFSVFLGALDAAFSVLVEAFEGSRSVGGDEGAVLSNPQTITCIIFENLFGPYFLPHQSHSYGYAPSSGENLTSKI